MIKGIILAGGTGTRLYPVTLGVSKQLIPVYDKPMIYYPLSVLMLAKIRDVLIITTPNDQEAYSRLLGDGTNLGMNIAYATQEKPDGLAQAFIIGEHYLGNSRSCLILGDNIFYGQGLTQKLNVAIERTHGGTVFGYNVPDPWRYGVATYDENYFVQNVEEKPTEPKSKCAVTGLYFYDENVTQIAKSVKPSKRGEVEITSINQEYARNNLLKISVLGRGFAWMDTGTHESLFKASQFVEAVQSTTKKQVACLEEIAITNKWITFEDLSHRIAAIANSSYAQYLKELLDAQNNE